jgi:hypothetical protein
MVFVAPSRFASAEEGEQLASFQFRPRGLDEKSAAAARPHQCIDLRDQVLGENDVGSLSVHRNSHC